MHNSDLEKANANNEQAIQLNDEKSEILERRVFLKKLGKYSAVTTTATVTLMTSTKVSALSPPAAPVQPDEGTWPD